MRYINPKTDFAFKKIFGSEESKEILISFLNAIIYENQEIIEDLEIIDPYQAPEIKGRKYTYLDVKARLKDGTKVIIEMQLLNSESLDKRIFYNAAKAYSMQLTTGQDYPILNPVIAVTITDFIMFDEFPSYLSCFVLKETTHLVEYLSNDFKLIFIELPKFNKSLDQLETLVEKWIYFLKSASQLEEVPNKLQGITAIGQAFEIALKTNLSELELDEITREEMFIQDQNGSITLAQKQARQQGIMEEILNSIELGLELKFGAEGLEIFEEIKKINKLETLKQIRNAIRTVNTLDEIRQIY